jgi:hypothetical protein
MDWRKAKRPNATEAVSPRDERIPLRGGSHVKPGPVKTWREMSPEERAAVLRSLQR